MVKKVVICAFIIVAFGCSSASEKLELSDLNIYIQTKQKIDSVFISNIAQDREFLMLQFQDTLKINLKDSINDLYNIWLYSEGKQYSGMDNQFLLSGEQIIIKGSFDKGFQLDTIIGSDVHYKHLNFHKTYGKLFQEKQSQDSINQFLLDFTQKNTDNLLSLQSAQYYLYSNGNDLEKIQLLQQALVNLDPALKSHSVFNAPKKIEKLLSLEKIDVEKYSYTTLSGEETKLNLDASKTYLLDLWFVNCPPCIQDHHKFQENEAFFKEKHIELIGLSTDSDQEKWVKFLEKKSYSWKNYRQSAYQNSMTEELMISVFPTYFLIKGDGTVLKSFHSYAAIEAYLKS